MSNLAERRVFFSYCNVSPLNYGAQQIPPYCPPRPCPCCCCIGIMFIMGCWTGGVYITCTMLLALCSCACSAVICCCCAAFVAVRFVMLPCDAVWPDANNATNWLYCASSVMSSAAFIPYPAGRTNVVGLTRRYSSFHRYLVSAQTFFWAAGSSTHRL